MASNGSTIRLRAGATAILAFLVFVIATGLVLLSGIDLQEIERGAIDVILPILTANPTVLAVVAWVVVIQSVLVSVFGIDLYRILADGRSGLVFAPVALIGGACLFIVEVLMVLGISQGLAPAHAGATGAEQSTIEATAQSLLLFRSHMLLVAGVLWSIAAIIFGREMLRTTAFPRWLAYGGYAAGVTGILGGFFPLFIPLLVVRSLSQLLFILWVLIAGVILLRNR